MAHLKIKVKSPGGASFEVSSQKESVSIGRSEKCDLVVKDESLSRHHALVENINDGLFITDTGSSNGVFVNGSRIPPNVKTPINTFFQITISELPCEITIEDGPELSSSRNSMTPATSSANHTTTTKIKPKAVVGTTPPKPKIDGPKKNFLLTAIVSVVLIAAGIYHTVTKEEEPSGPVAIAEAPVPQELAGVRDNFLTANEYKSLGPPGCEKLADLCAQMGLDPAKKEGGIVKDKELFVFMKPSEKYGDPKFEKIIELFDKDDLIVVSSLLRADIFADLEKKTIGQIHLIIIDAKGELIRSFRFHFKEFENGNGKVKIMGDLMPLLFTGANPDAYRQVVKTLVPVKEL